MILKTLSKLALTCAIVLIPAAARAACPVLPYTFTDNVSTVASATTNSNNQTLRSCAVNVDNTQIGSAGIRASQIIPDSVAAAIFGGTFAYQFPNGITLNAGSLTLAPLTTAGVLLNSATGVVSSSAGPLAIANGGTGSATQNFVDLTTAQTVAGAKTFSGALSTNSSLVLPVSGTLGSSLLPAFTNDGNTSGAGIFVNVATGGSGVRFLSNNSLTGAQITPTGQFVTGQSASGYFLGTDNVGVYFQYTSDFGTGYRYYWGTAHTNSVAGVTADAFRVGRLTPTGQELMTINNAGSMGIVGSYLSASRRELKNHIEPFTGPEALAFIGQTDWAKYAYKTEHAKTWRHLGLIANDSPEAFAGAGHDHIEISAVATAAAVAVHYQQKRIDDLEARLARLEARR